MIWCFLILGCAFRVLRYAQNLPLWSDECFLAVNFIHRGYLRLLGPLENGQIAPWLFLWVERATIDLGGFSEWTLRFFPLCCGVARLFLFSRLAECVFQDRKCAEVLAIGILAVSVHPIRHAAEAKPYAADLLVAVLLLWPAVAWLRAPRHIGLLWAMVIGVPIALALSNPSVFVAGGIALGLLVPVWRAESKSCRIALGCFVTMVVVIFSLQYLTVGRMQSAGAMDGLRNYWAASFPPVGSPWRLPVLVARSPYGSAFAYPGGGARGASILTTLAFLVGFAIRLRRREGAVVTCLVAPFGLALIASLLQQYPYGAARLMQWAAPSICLLAAEGLAWGVELIRSVRIRALVVGSVLATFVVIGVVPQVVSYAHPYRMVYDHEAREFARRFWVEQGRGARLVCADLDYGLAQGQTWLGRKSWYLCNQAIYSPQRNGREDPAAGEVSPSRPLRCVLFDQPLESPHVRDWLDRMASRFSLRETKEYPVKMTLIDGRKYDGTLERFRVRPPRVSAPGTECGPAAQPTGAPAELRRFDRHLTLESTGVLRQIMIAGTAC